MACQGHRQNNPFERGRKRKRGEVRLERVKVVTFLAPHSVPHARRHGDTHKDRYSLQARTFVPPYVSEVQTQLPHTSAQYQIQGSLIKWLGPVSGQWCAWPTPPCQHHPDHPPPPFVPSNTRQSTRKWGHAACTPIHLNSMTTTANKSFIHCLIYCLPGQKSCGWYEDRFTPCRWGTLERDFYCYWFPYQLVMCSLYLGAIKTSNDWTNTEGILSSQCQSNLNQFSHTFYFCWSLQGFRH